MVSSTRGKNNEIHRAHASLETANEEGMSLLDILGMVKRHLLIIFLMFLLVLCCMMYRYITTKSLYASQAILYISARNSQALINGQADISGQGLSDEQFLNTMVALLQNDKVLDLTWKAINDDPEKRNKIVNPSFAEGSSMWGQSVLQHLSIKIGGEGDIKKANVFQVTFISSSPKEAYQVIRELIDQFQSYFNQQYAQSTDVIGETIRQGRDELDAVIKKSTEELANFIESSKTSFIGDQANNPLLTRLQSLEETLVTLDFQILKYQNRLNMIDKALKGREISNLADEEIITILGAGEETQSGGGMEQHLSTLSYLAQGGKLEDSLNSTLLQLDIQQSTTMLLEIAKLKEQNIGEDNPRIVALRKGYEDLMKFKKDKTGYGEELGTINKIGVFTYDSFLTAYINILKERIAALNEQRGQIQEYIDSQDSQVREITKYCQTIESMKFSIESQKEFYYQLDRKMDQVTLLRNYGGYQVEIISPPRESIRPISPNLMKYLALGIIFGLVCGFGVAFLSDVTDTTFRSPEEVGMSLGVPLLAQLPTFRAAKQTKIRDKKMDQGVPILSLVAYHFPNSPQCEVFRALRTMLFLNSTGPKPQIVMCTSPHSGDGKSMFVSSMAIKTADAGKKVLLMDGDIRKPDIHKWFNMENTDGFADLLTGEAKLEDVIRPTAVKNLSIISAGVRRKNPSELLATPRLEEIIAQVRTQYDIIFIDSSPILYVSDPCIVASKVDGVLYSFRIRRRGRPDVVQGIRMLADIGAKVLGCVVNCHDKHRFYDELAVAKKSTYGNYGYGNPYGYGNSYGYGNGYGYGYGYGYGSGGYGYGFGYGDKKYGDAVKPYLSDDDKIKKEKESENA